jgi:dipeptidase
MIRLVLLTSGTFSSAFAEHVDEQIGCTAIAIDGAASIDGSAFAGMNADSGGADYRLTFVPSRRPTEKMRPVYTYNLSYPRFVGYGRGEFYHPQSSIQPLFEPVGYIPEVSSTFGYYDAVEPLLNDQGLGIGESSCASNLMNKFPGDSKDTRDVPTGLLDTVTLMQLALERCATARCAVDLMGNLSDEFGFVPTPGEPVVGSVVGRVSYDDAGEAYTVADRTGEAWVFHVGGGVTGIAKSVWAAQKVPKGHFAVVANDFTIGELPDEPNEEFRFNKAIRRVALAADLWDGKQPFHFGKAFSPNPLSFESPTGNSPIPLYAALRRWNLYNLVAPSLKLAFSSSNQEYPFSVKIEKKITHRDVMSYFRYMYEGTEFDLTQGILAGPFGTPFRIEGTASGQVPRGISIQRTLYGIISQTGPLKQMGWFAMDAPTTSVYVPLSTRSGAVSKAYSSGHQAKFSRDSAAWAFNFVNNFMQLNYRAMSQQEVYPAIQTWQDTIDEECKSAEQAQPDALDAWQISVQERVVSSWWNMSEFLIMRYNDGRDNVPTVGNTPGYPQWYADMIGFGQDVHPIWVQAASRPASNAPPGYVPAVSNLPQVFNFTSKTWSYAQRASSMMMPETLGTGSAALTLPTLMAIQAAMTILVLCGGVAIGRAFERRKHQNSGNAYVRLL